MSCPFYFKSTESYVSENVCSAFRLGFSPDAGPTWRGCPGSRAPSLWEHFWSSLGKYLAGLTQARLKRDLGQAGCIMLSSLLLSVICLQCTNLGQKLRTSLLNPQEEQLGVTQTLDVIILVQLLQTHKKKALGKKQALPPDLLSASFFN